MALNRACTFPRYIVFFNKPPWVIIDTAARFFSLFFLLLYFSRVYICFFSFFPLPLLPFLEFISFSPVLLLALLILLRATVVPSAPWTEMNINEPLSQRSRNGKI